VATYVRDYRPAKSTVSRVMVFTAPQNKYTGAVTESLKLRNAFG
jgi:hypothetical protein